jgi:hypothetical protein
MENNIETYFIKRLKKDTRNLYLNFLVSNGNELNIFYKHSVKFSKKMFIYKVNDEIKGIVGFSHNLTVEKSAVRASYSMVHIRLIYCNDIQLFKKMMNDIEKYTMDKKIPLIVINHMKLYDTVLKELDYENYYCDFIGVCFNCIEGLIEYKLYSKELFDCDTNRFYYRK